MGGQASSDQSKGMFWAELLSNSRAPLGALCVPGSGPQHLLQVLFGHLGDRLGIVTRNTKILCFCAEGANDILPAPSFHLRPDLGKGFLFPPVRLHTQVPALAVLSSLCQRKLWELQS